MNIPTLTEIITGNIESSSCDTTVFFKKFILLILAKEKIYIQALLLKNVTCVHKCLKLL